MTIALNINNLLVNKKILFSGFAGIGGIVSGLLMLNVFNDIGAWFSWVGGGALDAACIGVLVVYAQNYYQTKSLAISSGLLEALKKGLIVGGIGGLISYFGMLTFGAGEFGRFIGWAISGGVAGYVVSQQVPNLEKSKAIIAGSVGGGIGCLSMQIGFGYTIGVAITGAAIGFMVALAEVVFRKNWIDVEIFSSMLGTGLNLAKPINQFTLALGANPITVGVADGMNIRLKAGISTSSAHCASIYLDGDNVFFHSLADNNKTKLVAGQPFRYGESLIKLGL